MTDAVFRSSLLCLVPGLLRDLAPIDDGTPWPHPAGTVIFGCTGPCQVTVATEVGQTRIPARVDPGDHDIDGRGSELVARSR
jgi:hypothetical protein